MAASPNRTNRSRTETQLDTPKEAANLLVTAKRMFTRPFHLVVSQYASDERGASRRGRRVVAHLLHRSALKRQGRNTVRMRCRTRDTILRKAISRRIPLSLVNRCFVPTQTDCQTSPRRITQRSLWTNLNREVCTCTTTYRTYRLTNAAPNAAHPRPRRPASAPAHFEKAPARARRVWPWRSSWRRKLNRVGGNSTEARNYET